MTDAPFSPDCRPGKHTACTGDAWDTAADQVTPCGCTCHAPRGGDQ